MVARPEGEMASIAQCRGPSVEVGLQGSLSGVGGQLAGREGDEASIAQGRGPSAKAGMEQGEFAPRFVGGLLAPRPAPGAEEAEAGELRRRGP